MIFCDSRMVLAAASLLPAATAFAVLYHGAHFVPPTLLGSLAIWRRHREGRWPHDGTTA